MKKILRTRTVNTLIAFSAAGILLFFLLSYSDTRSTPLFESDTAKEKRPRFFLVGTSSRLFDDKGYLELAVSSEHIEHNPIDNSAAMRKPIFNVYRQGVLYWTINAEQGIAYAGNEKVELKQRVIAQSSNQETTMKTPQLYLFPNKKVAKTDRAVQLVNIHGTTQSIGLHANLNRKRITLLSNVKSQYEPQKASEYAP